MNSTTQIEKSNIEKAVEIIGGQSKVANLLTNSIKRVKQNNVHYWVNKHKQAPAKYILKIAELTKGEITAEQLLADHEKNAQKERNQ